MRLLSGEVKTWKPTEPPAEETGAEAPATPSPSTDTTHITDAPPSAIRTDGFIPQESHHEITDQPATTTPAEGNDWQHAHYHGTLRFDEEEDSPLRPEDITTADPLLAQFLQSHTPQESTGATNTPAYAPSVTRKNLLFARRIVSVMLGLCIALVVHAASVVEENPLAYAKGSWQSSLVWAFASDDGYANLHKWALLWPWLTFELAVHIYLLLPAKMGSSAGQTEPFDVIDTISLVIRSYLYIREVWNDPLLIYFQFCYHVRFIGICYVIRNLNT